MKQKKYLFTFAASMLLAAGMVSCTKTDNPSGPDIPDPILPEAPYEFDEGSLVVNGQCDGAEVQSYWCHEWRPDGYVDGPAQIIVDPADPTNRCAAVVIRSEEEAQAAGNPTLDQNGNFADWDSQFFITFPEELALKEKDKIRLTMKVKADVEMNGVATQAHQAPGGYKHWACVGNVNFTTDWTDFDSGWVTVDNNMASMYTIAFNLAKGIHNIVYFDDIRVEIISYDPFEDGNFVKNGKFNGDDASNFTCHEWRTMDAQFDGVANIVADPANENNRCAAVVIRSQEEAQAAGNPTLDQNGNFADWDSQFFITFGEENKLNAGDKIKLTMRVKADAELSGVGTQAHQAPGGYKHWACVGNVNFTTEWTDFDSGWVTVDGNMASMYTIAFNLAKGGHNTVYFDDIRVEIEKAPAIENWTNLVVNGDCEGDDASCLIGKDGDGGGAFSTNFVGGLGINGSRCVVVKSHAGAAEGWDTQFFIKVDHVFAEGESYKFKMMVKADDAATASTQAHKGPGEYLHWAMVGDIPFTSEWKEFKAEGVITAEQAGMSTIALNLNDNKELATQFYFDNIEFSIAK